MIIKLNMASYKSRSIMGDLSLDRKKEIEAQVKRLIGDFDYKKSSYVDIVSIVKKDGFIVEPKDMDINTTGCLFIDHSDERNIKRNIWVNTRFKNPDNEADIVFKKSRFITAHEYGHFILHNSISAHRDTDHRTDEIELEADYFARSILMPFSYFKICYDLLMDFGKNDEEYVVNILTRFFKVTKNKVCKRIGDIKEFEGAPVLD